MPEQGVDWTKRQLWVERMLNIAGDCCGCSGDEYEVRKLYDEAYNEGYEDGVNA